MDRQLLCQKSRLKFSLHCGFLRLMAFLTGDNTALLRKKAAGKIYKNQLNFQTYVTAVVVRCAQVLYTENRQWSTNNDKYTFKVSLHCVFYVQWPFSLVTIQHFHERKQLVKSTKTNSTFRPQLLYISAQTLPTSYFYGDSCWSIKSFSTTTSQMAFSSCTIGPKAEPFYHVKYGPSIITILKSVSMGF